MFEIYVILFTLSLTILFNFISKKNHYLIDKKFTPHKSFASKNLTPVTGGLVFFLSGCIFMSFENQLMKFLIFIIFIVGYLSDINYLVSPLKRFILQILIVIILIYFNEIFINSVRIPLLDNLLDNILFKYFFTALCFLILINGSNFIDGVNTLLLGYFLSVTIISFFVINDLELFINSQNYIVIIILLSILFFFNFFGKLFSGDSGAYLISLIIGYLMINLVNLTDAISPYFIACLLWYPAYECLFSIIRKRVNQKSISEPDNLHLHQLILSFYKRKLNFKENKLNTITGISINLFNILIFLNAVQNISQTKNLVLLITICLMVYNGLYFYLIKTSKNLI